MKKDLLIFPFNGNGMEAVACIGDQFNLIGFVDDTEEKQGKEIGGVKVFSREAFNRYPNAVVLAVPGGPATYMHRENIINNLNISISRFATVIHPAAFVSPMATIGSNVLLMAGVVLTSNCVIGNHVCILPNSVIHHDTIIGEFTLVCSNVTISGYTKVGRNCYIGSSSSIINGVEIGSKSLIGMGSNVLKSIPENSKSAGNPARLL